MQQRSSEEAIHAGRARVLADLGAGAVAGPEEVSLLEEAVSHRRWWCDQWPEGAAFLPGLLAQDMQDALLERSGRWPLCPLCASEEPHALQVHPELGEDPYWVCEATGRTVAPVGGLPGDRHED
ncbi:hypothetical protein PJ985_10815 [Streptomyces sp. ACA25]|uniref:hypothetical protein n=1 Tax=Streptomyces sp. ACA25 TaxID=3022596 RepID=UPI0023082776|nr:hypothetical protein [Streptomyces sp. ACA25]MDB1088056.1 hypothetical protein [Streptomyces sp. ACA25]